MYFSIGSASSSLTVSYFSFRFSAGIVEEINIPIFILFLGLTHFLREKEMENLFYSDFISSCIRFWEYSLGNAFF